VNTFTTPNTVLVMGAGDSLGSALARRFAGEGMQVCVARPNTDLLAPLVERLRHVVRQARSLICCETVGACFPWPGACSRWLPPVQPRSCPGTGIAAWGSPFIAGACVPW
jgi:NAD(P)-dependent dehydrogenase (short-subunit alcohol dehydrogenase family)